MPYGIPLHIVPAVVPDSTSLLSLLHWEDRRRDSSHKIRTQRSDKDLICCHSSGIHPEGRHSRTPRSLHMLMRSPSPYTLQNHLLIVLPAQNGLDSLNEIQTSNQCNSRREKPYFFCLRGLIESTGAGEFFATFSLTLPKGKCFIFSPVSSP